MCISLLPGESRSFGHVFLFDTGTSNGNLSGQSRSMSSIDFRPARPYRLVSASEDNTVALFEGPPFKFKTTFFRSFFLFTVILYEGVEGGKQGEFVDQSCKGNAHDGGVFGLCWSPDDSNIATASGDKTVKVWNVATKMLLKFVFFLFALLSIIWTKCGLFSVSLSGFIHCLDLETGSVVKTLRGHNKPITTLAVSADKSTAFTADFE
uniref:WD_REPEATS_REGION domain-containing protein n=1 Tax=Parascaris equorum TaxID=6256 RepID=A0A914REL4_PAREQ